MLRNSSPLWFALLIWSFLAINLCISFNVISALKISKDVSSSDHDRRFHLVTKEERGTIAETEDGVISSVRISDGFNRTYHLQFITLEPNSLFLPVLLHADMVFYVHSGSGSMRWIDEENKKNHIDVEKGDIYRFLSGSVFYMRSNLESTREKLRIYSIFTDSNIENPPSLYIGAYSTLNDLVRGFENKVLQTAFNVPEEVLDEITKASKPPAIVHSTTTTKDKHSEDEPDWRSGIIESLVKRGSSSSSSSGDDYSNGKKKKKTETVNLFKRKPDFSNCNGWSIALTNKDASALKDSDMGIFMVNLTKGSMMGPHWNPRASEIAIVTHGQGMITVVCPGNANGSGCKNMRFKVKEGDVFTVPRFHPMAQMAYNNDSLVFMGFNTNARENHPQFLAGKSSVFRTLNKDILAMSFNVPNTTMEQLLGSQVESIILECLSCAEEEEDRMREEEQRERREEEEMEREKEEAKRREEEEKARERERQEEEERRREEEKARERERQEEEERIREEEEARRRQEEARREEEEAKRQEEARRRKEEQQRKQEEEAKRRQEGARREEEEAKREEEKRQERERKQREEQERQEKEAQQQEEEAQRRQEAEEAQRRQQEEEARRAEEARRGQVEEARKEEAAARRRQKEEARRAEDEEARRQERQEEAESRRKEEERQQTERQEEEARRAEVERQQKEREIEEAKRAEEERQQREGEREETRQERQQTEREEEEARRAEVARRQKEREMEEAKRADDKRQRRGREREEARQEEEERSGGGGEETRRVLNLRI
ncbi:hypothetical protein MKW98_027206 [Papaver atlanticum]|uniref:Cupin type-1 domain-containing protein n=1 Tax=Papaver atlanticum TaxID=357466 RepID=A0AAD4SDT6_9MAGN|nr:hypothetical protein MKW98_027206 [Papaver atlanticum]